MYGLINYSLYELTTGILPSMKNKKLLLFSLFLYISNLSFGQAAANLNTEPELMKTWNTFTKAIKDSDKNSLQTICTDSVKFSMQMGDLKLLASASDESAVESNKDVIIDFDNYFYIMFDEFYTYEMPQIFDNNVITRLNDKSKLRLIKSNEPDADFKFFVTVTDPDPEDGVAGNEMVLRFKKNGGNYRFSGIDTIQ
jgi:hypothetical protein